VFIDTTYHSVLENIVLKMKKSCFRFGSHLLQEIRNLSTVHLHAVFLKYV
jgi:hypothetical protein